jgi:NAD(P)-dependent dehydrogenase (short-subunit alcohol dehydrogenase family)
MCRKLAAEGKQVIHSCRNPTLCKESAVELRKSTGNPDIQVLLLDVTNEDSLKSAVDEVKEFYDEEIDVLVSKTRLN